MSTISELALLHLEGLKARWPAVRDGDTEAIHDARVATRRLRAVLPLVGGERLNEQTAEVAAMLKTIARALGKARDPDEALTLLAEIERRSPPTAAAAAVLRARLLPEQLRHRRRLIKTLENTNLDLLDQWHDALGRGGAGASAFGWRRRSDHSRLAAMLSACATRVEERVDHASGVYFPKRAHKARVAIKRLRYAVELMDRRETIRKPSNRLLRRAQEVLGAAHDREVLLERVRSLSDDGEVPAARELAMVLEAETRSLFEQYRGLRPAILAACHDLCAWSRREAAGARRLLMVTAVALPSAAVLLATRARRAS